MLALGVYRSFINANIRQFSAYRTCKSCKHSKNSIGRVDVKLVPAGLSSGQGLLRSYSNEPQAEQRVQLPQLMEFPEITWPNFFNTVRNWFLANMIIRPYFDKDFNMVDFITGSRQAMSIISHALAREDYESLNGLVTDEAIQSLKGRVSSFTARQREEIPVAKDDVYFCYPYQIGVIFHDDKGVEVQKRFVEITMVYHALKGLKRMQDENNPPPLNMGVLPEYQKNISICNYRFIREFTKDVESPWVVNIVNHFKPISFSEKMDQEK